MSILIRKGKVEDAKGVVEVNTYTWETTYKGLMPDEVLEERIKTMDERIPKMAESVRKKDNLFVAEDNDKIVGMMTYGPSRNEEYQEIGQIYAIYVLKEYQGLGIGKKLFMTGIKELIGKGYNSMIVNVLDGNKTRKFYEKYGGKKVGKIEDYFGNAKLTEHTMYFENLDKIYSEFMKK